MSVDPELPEDVPAREPHPLRLIEYLRYIDPWFDPGVVPPWPPDVFALALSVLWKSASYTAVLNSWPPETNESWEEHASKHAASWRQGWSSGYLPPLIKAYWAEAFEELEVPLRDLQRRPRQLRALLCLTAIADEASAYLGIPVQEPLTESEELFRQHGDERLTESSSHGTSLCEKLDGTRLRVLPKTHCPQAGLTIRSFSRHLALYQGNEILPTWYSRNLDAEAALNLLVVPWPYEISPRQFRACQALQGELRNMDPKAFGFFTLDIDEEDLETVHRLVEATVDAAERFMGRVHGVILPELALSNRAYEQLKQTLMQRDIFLVSGVGSAQSVESHARNEVHVTFPNYPTVIQQKHHRWKLDESQLVQYGLGSRLAPEIQWWEHICVDDRKLGLFSVLPWLVATVLICEDLARPDPVGDLVRSVGPNLVIALLMDGPQIKERWSARYATTLADDPGSSVLSVTSLGMAKLSRPRGAQVDNSRIVAIWKDAKSGGPVQIELPRDHHGVVLSLTRQDDVEWTADGRTSYASYPALTGIHPIKRLEKA